MAKMFDSAQRRCEDAGLSRLAFLIASDARRLVLTSTGPWMRLAEWATGFV